VRYPIVFIEPAIHSLKEPMKNPFAGRLPSFDANAINDTIQRALASAGIDSSSGPMRDTSNTIRRALGALQPDAQHREHSKRKLPSELQTHTFSSSAGSRVYKVYLPQTPTDAPRPMLVMLHGCTQSADDFAAGTQMNRLADQHGFLVVYPEQAAQANPSKCWNWFSPQDQRHGAGEPALIAGIAVEVAQHYGADPQRIFVAGLSAGAAMAVVLGETYPEVFAAVGAHSGLAYGSAHDVASAMAAMKGGRSGLAGLKTAGASAAAQAKKAAHSVPVIVFHGDRDHTVHQSNGADITQQALDAHRMLRGTDLSAHTVPGSSADGRTYSRTLHTDAHGQVRIENWTLHGAGHAWSGGHASGSYTDAHGPDASAEMVRFFLSLAAPAV
jgi:poly(hydroxyalkanoate) depolymerase family esterase